MKKLYSLALMAALVLAGCNPEEKPGLDGDDTKDPVLGEIAGCVLDNSGADILVDFEAADFGNTAVVNYAIFVDQAGNEMKTKQQVKIAVKDTKIAIPQSNLNRAILALGAEVAAEVEVDLQLTAYIGSSIGASALHSNIVSAKFTTCAGEIKPLEEYPFIYAVGNFSGWEFDSTPGEGISQFLFDYAKTSNVYEGVLCLNGQTQSGWKLSGTNGWDDSMNWGFNEDGEEKNLLATDPEGPFTLQCSGGSKDMKAWSRNFIYPVFDRTTLELKLKTMNSWGDTNYAIQFDYMVLTGSFCDWAETAEEGAVIMGFDPILHRFFGDITLAEDGNVKCFAPNANYDHKWRLQWGQGSGEGCGNVAVPAGSYRVYLNVDTDAFEVVESDFGAAIPEHAITEFAEPYVAVPEPSTWQVVGTFNEWGNDAETDTYEMSCTSYHQFVYYGLELEAGAALKVRGDHSWDESYGTAEGSDVTVDEAGTYDIFFDYDNKVVTVTPCHLGWSAIGEINGNSWTLDFDLTEVSEGVWVSKGLELAGGFKLRYRHSWDTQVGADGEANQNLEVGVPCTGISTEGNSSDFKVPAKAIYKITYDANAGSVTIDSAYPDNCWMTGSLNSWDWETAVQLTPVYGHPGHFWAVRHLEAGAAFKFNTATAWDGGETGSVGEAVGFTAPEGKDGYVEAENLYIIYVDYENNKTTIAPAEIFGMGECFANGWNEGTPASVNADFTASVTTANEAQIRLYAAAPAGYSVDWWQMEFVFYEDGVIVYRGMGGDQDRYTVAAGKTITLDFNAGTASVN